jgi:arylsulfatase
VSQKPTTFLKTAPAGIFSACCAFLFLYSVELLITLWVSRKFHYSKMLCHVAAYLILGAGLGMSVAVAHAVLVRLRRKSMRAGTLFFVLCGAGLPLLLALIVLNIQYLPAPAHAPVRLVLSLGLVLFSAALAFLFYRTSRAEHIGFPLFRTAGICCSMAAVLAVFNAFASRQAGKEWFDIPHAAALAFLLVVTGALVALIDMGITGWFASLRKERAGERHFGGLLLIKAGAVAIALIVLSYLRIYEPSEGKTVTDSSTASAGRPNVILLVLDTARIDRLSAYGFARETSPNLEKFARQWLVFDAYSTASWTLPAHASLLTGLYPTENGTGPDRNYRLDPRNTTLAEVLRHHGYATAAVVSNHLVLGNSSGFEQGFDYYYANPRETDPAFTLIAACLLNRYVPDLPWLTVVPFKRADAINAEAAHWLELHSRQPFFLFINYMEPHTPYHPPYPYGRRWRSAGPPANFFGPHGIWHGFSRAVNEGKRVVSDAEREHLLSLYKGELHYLDEQVSAFIERLKQLGIYDNSMILITSDHGEAFSEHGLVEHQRVLYQELIRVPLLVKLPAGQEPPLQPAGPVSLVDLFPTILATAGIPHGAGSGAGSIFEAQSPEIFCETHSVGDESGPEFRRRFGTSLYSLIHANYKLIYSSTKAYEFYDLSIDPLEMNNLIKSGLEPDVAVAMSEMKARLASRIEQLHANRLVPAESGSALDEEIRSRLKAIGYIQ